MTTLNVKSWDRPPLMKQLRRDLKYLDSVEEMADCSPLEDDFWPLVFNEMSREKILYDAIDAWFNQRSETETEILMRSDPRLVRIWERHERSPRPTW